MNDTRHSTPGIGTSFLIILCLLLMAAAARADDGGSEPEAGDEAGDRTGDEAGDETGTGDEAGDETGTGDEAGDETGDETGTGEETGTGDEDEAGTEDPGGEPGESEEPCLEEPVVVVRVRSQPWEAQRLSLTRCDGKPHRGAIDALSILARPRGVERPSAEERAGAPDDDHVAPGVARLHPGLLTRLQALADRWPGRRIEIVSGFRPDARNTSRHHHARALDLRVQGVGRRDVSDFARTLDHTGVGFYPNSVFTHVDVRRREAYWVDRSAPGEPADYGPWPPEAPRKKEEARDRVLADALEALDRL
ncbi:MAG: YcbK family protein [Myxococcota bacterium]